MDLVSRFENSDLGFSVGWYFHVYGNVLKLLVGCCFSYFLPHFPLLSGMVSDDGTY